MSWSLALLIALCPIRALAASSVPSAESCCRRRGVSDACASALCNAASPPGDFERYSLFEPPHNCSRHLADIAHCLADGRDNTACCETHSSTRADESSCFALCRGSFPTLTPGAWNTFQTCIALNMPSIYSCFASGYKSSPTPPREVRITARTTDSVSISWRVPAENAELVAAYRVVLLDQSGVGKPLETVQETTDTVATLSGLKAKSAYSIHVIAYSKSASKRSLPSDSIHLTPDADPGSGVVLSSGRALVQLPREAKSTTIACRLRIANLDQRIQIEWEKKEAGEWKKVEGARFKTNYYMSGDVETVYLSSLEFRHFQAANDFGLYRCISKTSRELAEVELVPHSAAAVAPSSPPETPLECCQRSFVRPACQSICSAGAEVPRGGVKPGAFLPSYRCDDEMMNLLACSLADTRSSACCVRKKIPYHCIGLCDKDVRLGKQLSASCMEYMDKITECHTESHEMRPRAVDNVRIDGDSSSASAEWDASEGASVYHVYHRKRGSREWKVQSSTKPSARVSGAEEVVIVAANAFGSTGALRFSFEGGKWLTSYEV